MNEWKPLPAWRRTAAPGLALVTLALVTTLCLGLLPSTAAGSTGRAASTTIVNDTGHLHLAHFNGSTLQEEGKATGTLPGTVRATLVVGTSTVRVSFTIYLRNGTLAGHATAKLNPGKGEYASFAGSLTVNHGAGHYARASGSGRVSGTINRNEDAAVVQVEGQLHI